MAAISSSPIRGSCAFALRFAAVLVPFFAAACGDRTLLIDSLSGAGSIGALGDGDGDGGALGPGSNDRLEAGSASPGRPSSFEGGTVGALDGGSTTPPTDASLRLPEAGGALSCTPRGTVTFRMRAATNGGGYGYVASFGNPGDGDWWYSVAKTDGTPVPIFLSGLPICGTCESLPDPVGGVCSSLPAGGVTATWNGTAVAGSSTCQEWFGPEQGSETVSCQAVECLPAGEYVVTMCATTGESCGTPDGGSSCVAVPFDYPTESEVIGELP